MGLGHSPRIVTDGLVLALDAGNPKNYNAGISTNWTDKVGGNNGTLVNGTYHNDGPFVGAGYVEFDGTGDYLRPASSSDFAFGTSDFTIELWINILTTANDGILQLSTTSGGFSTSYTNGLALVVYQGELYYAFGGEITNTGTTINDGTWRHIAMCRSGSSLKIFVNGVSIVSETNTGNVSATNLVIGGYYSTSYTLDGKISNLRILKGTALYTSDFTPPTKLLTAITNTVLLTCQGNTIADASSSGHSISVTGNAAANLGFPASAFEFDGTDDYLTTTSNTEVGFGTGDFTIESWFYSNGNQALFAALVSLNNGSGGNDWQFEASGNKISVRSLFTPTATYTHLAWHQASWIRQGSSNYLFLDGVQIGTFTDSTDWDYGTINVGSNRAYNNLFNGKISAVKIYKGKGLTAAEVQQNYNALKGRYV